MCLYGLINEVCRPTDNTYYRSKTFKSTHWGEEITHSLACSLRSTPFRCAPFRSDSLCSTTLRSTARRSARGLIRE